MKISQLKAGLFIGKLVPLTITIFNSITLSQFTSQHLAAAPGLPQPTQPLPHPAVFVAGMPRLEQRLQ